MGEIHDVQPEWNRTLGRYKPGWKDNIKMDLKGAEKESV
jgi:hypothetical protein